MPTICRGVPKQLGYCSKYSIKLDAEVKINSRKNEGTEINVHFPKSRIETEFAVNFAI